MLNEAELSRDGDHVVSVADWVMFVKELQHNQHLFQLHQLVIDTLVDIANPVVETVEEHQEVVMMIVVVVVAAAPVAVVMIEDIIVDIMVEVVVVEVVEEILMIEGGHECAQEVEALVVTEIDTVVVVETDQETEWVVVEIVTKKQKDKTATTYQNRTKEKKEINSIQFTKHTT